MRSLPSPRRRACAVLSLALTLMVGPLAAQAVTGETRDPRQTMDETFDKAYREWTLQPRFGSPLVDHLPLVKGIPTPRDVLGYHIGAPRTLTYYADQLRYYRALAAATPRVRVETIGTSDEGRELVVVWVSSDENMRKLQTNRDNLKKIADPRGLSESQIQTLINTTRPHYHLMGGLHSGETGPSEMLMELVYRLATETSPIISRIREQVIVSVTPTADADGRDRNVDWFYHTAALDSAGGGRGGSLPYWGKYAYHDNNRDINLSLQQMRAITDWYFTAHPPIMHDLHESLQLLYTYSGGAPQNPNLDPLLFAELPWFANFEMAQMTKYGMPGVYTHAFMDGWSPGYLGSVAYNHNGMMKMYETQSGRDITTGAAPGGRGAAGAGAAGPGRGAAAAAGAGAGAAGAAAGPGRGAAGPGRGAQGAAGPGRGGQAGQGAAGPGRGGQGQGQQAGPGRGAAAANTPTTIPAGRGGTPTGRGGAQDREWYRGIPVGFDDLAQFTRRANANYMQTGVLSALQLTSLFPTTVVENFYIKTRNSINEGRTKAPFGYMIPVQRDMTRAADLVNILRAQGIEIGLTTAEVTLGERTYPVGSYVIKRDQPYGRLAKNLLERQIFPDARLSTYDDSGWSMGWAMNVEVVEVADSAILRAPARLVDRAAVTGRVTGSGTAGIAIAHLGSNNMITFRYALRQVPMQVAEQSFTVEGVEYPAGSFIVRDMAQAAAVRAAVAEHGLTAAALTALPVVPTHDADPPRVAIYSQWSGTQSLGWYRLTFDNFKVPFDLIFKERVAKGNLRADYDVILMAEQTINRQNVMAAPSALPQPYQRSEKFKFLGMYGETPDMSGGFGQPGVDAFGTFLREGGTLIAIGSAARFPIEFGWARTVETQSVPGLSAQRPLVQGRIVKTDHPVFYGYGSDTIPLKFVGGASLRTGVADQGNVLAQYVGGEESVLSGLMTGADSLRGRAFAVDIPGANNGQGRVVLFSNNPIYRWQNHGEFSMVFNTLLNWNDVPKAVER